MEGAATILWNQYTDSKGGEKCYRFIHNTKDKI